MKIAFGLENYANFVNFGINYTSFNEEVDDGECTSIYAPKILDYIPQSDFVNFITTLTHKMRHGCEIVIGGTDIYESAKQLLRGDHNVAAVNEVLYGSKDVKKVGQYSLNIVNDILVANGLKILNKLIDGNEMCVRAIRE